MKASNKEINQAYNNGYAARKDGQSQAVCPYGLILFNLRCQWLAGWNDADLEDVQ
jgi:ribosome modulation factor